MELDPRSLIAASVLSAVLLGTVSVAFAALRGPTRIVGDWGVAILTFAAGLLGLALRERIPDWGSVALANALLIAGWVLALRSLQRFVGAPRRDRAGWILVGLMFLFQLYFTEVRPHVQARVVAMGLVAGTLAAVAALLLRRRAPADCRVSCRFAEAVFWAIALLNAARVVVASLQAPRDLLAPAPFSPAVFLFFSAFVIVSTLAVFAMEIESLQSALRRAARFDALTGLLNRGAFLEEFSREEARAERGGPPFSLAVLDLDHFKSVNDRHGHPAGDRVLAAFAEILRETIRPYDSAGRYGGEEFALLMPQTDKATAAAIVGRVRQALEARGVVVEGRRIGVTVSAGIASHGVDGGDWETLLSAADTALYDAKNAGRNRVVAAGA
jgi:diguanylate cyclase (GGDEF)-like protein